MYSCVLVLNVVACKQVTQILIFSIFSTFYFVLLWEKYINSPKSVIIVRGPVTIHLILLCFLGVFSGLVCSLN